MVVSIHSLAVRIPGTRDWGTVVPTMSSSDERLTEGTVESFPLEESVQSCGLEVCLSGSSRTAADVATAS